MTPSRLWRTHSPLTNLRSVWPSLFLSHTWQIYKECYCFPCQQVMLINLCVKWLVTKLRTLHRTDFETWLFESLSSLCNRKEIGIKWLVSTICIVSQIILYYVSKNTSAECLPAHDLVHSQLLFSPSNYCVTITMLILLYYVVNLLKLVIWITVCFAAGITVFYGQPARREG